MYSNKNYITDLEIYLRFLKKNRITANDISAKLTLSRTHFSKIRAGDYKLTQKNIDLLNKNYGHLAILSIPDTNDGGSNTEGDGNDNFVLSEPGMPYLKSRKPIEGYVPVEQYNELLQEYNQLKHRHLNALDELDKLKNVKRKKNIA